MHRPSRSTEHDGERGSAALEFILVGLLLLVPIVYLIVSLGMIQGQTLGVESGARHIARAIATADDPDTARLRADAIARTTVEAYGLDPAETELSLRCHPAGGGCPRAGAVLVVTMRTRVALPLVPPVLGMDRAASIPIEADSAQKVLRSGVRP